MASDAEVDLVVNATRALATVQRDLDDLVRTAENDTDPVRVQAALNRIISQQRVADDLNAVIRRAEADADAIRVRVDVDEDDVRRIGDADGSLTRLAGTASRALGPIAGLAGGLASAGAAAGSAVPLIAGVVAATESLVPAAAVAASGLLAIKAASTVVKIAMIGVQDAIETAFDPEATPEELAKAMERLAPEARDFVQSLADLRSEFDEVRLDFQTILFRNFGDVVDRLGQTVLPRLSRAGSVIAETLNEMGHQAATAATDFAESGAFGQAINGTIKGLQNLESVPAQAITAFGQLAAASAPAFDRITKAAGRAFDSISEGLTEAFESGALEDSINAAIDNFAQLGRIAGNILGGLSNIFNAVSADGEGLFSVVETLSQAFEDLTASKDFQRALSALSETMALIARTAAPLLITAFEIIGDIVIAIAPSVQKLVAVLGDALGRTLEALGPVLVSLAEAFAALIPVITPFIELAGTLLQAILPALIPLFEALAGIFEAITPFAQQLADNLATQLVPILSAIGPVLGQILPPFVDLANVIFPLLTQVLADLQPSLAIMATTFADIFVELGPLIAEVLNLVVALLVELTPVIAPLLKLLTDLIELGMSALADIIHSTVIPALQILTDLLRGDVEGAFNQFKDTGSTVVADTIVSFRTFRDRVAEILNRVVTQVPELAQRAMEGLIRSFRDGASNALEFIRQIPENIARSFLGLPGKLYEIGQNILDGLIDGIASQIGQLRSIVSEIGNIVPDTIGSILGIASPSKLMREYGQFTGEGLRLGLMDSLPDIRRAVSNIAMTIPQDTRRAVTPVAVPGMRPQPPSFNIQIGNHVLNEFVDYRLRQATDAAQYRHSKGVRF